MDSKAKDQLEATPYLSLAFLNNPEAFIAQISKPTNFESIISFVKGDKRKQKKNSFSLDPVARFILNNRIGGLSRKDITKAKQLSLTEFSTKTTKAFYKITGKAPIIVNGKNTLTPEIEALQFIMLRMHNPRLSWADFQAFKVRAEVIESIIDNNKKSIASAKLRGADSLKLQRDSALQDIAQKRMMLMLSLRSSSEAEKKQLAGIWKELNWQKKLVKGRYIAGRIDRKSVV